MTKPVQTFREGAVGASIWERKGKRGMFYDFTLSRAYQSKEGKNSYSPNFSELNVDGLIQVIGDAVRWIRRKTDDPEPTIANSEIGGGTGRGNAAEESLDEADQAAVSLDNRATPDAPGGCRIKRPLTPFQNAAYIVHALVLRTAQEHALSAVKASVYAVYFQPGFHACRIPVWADPACVR